MDAIILAAGRGSRLGGRSPKCLVRVGDRTLLEIQLDNLRRAGVDNVTVVVGYRHEEVREAASGEATFVFNERFADTNSLYSFHLARRAVADDLLVLNSDVLFPLELLSRLRDVEGSALAFDSCSGDDAEHMKVHLRDGHLVRMSKRLPSALTAGENVGLLQLSAYAARACFDAAATLVRRGHHHDWVGSAVSAIADAHRIFGVDITGLPWVEIDYPEDLVLAREQIWPAIESLDLCAQRPGLLEPVGMYDAGAAVAR
ncbi:MAG: phosphocholine cytidylyltransferase family protein [Marmoricola sp.]